MGRKSRRRAKFYRPDVLLQQLEERIVLDAAVNPAVKENPDNTSANQPDGGAAATNAAPAAPAGTADLVPQLPHNLDQVFHGDLNVVLVAKDLADAQTFADAAPKDAKVIMFDAQHDNLASINTMLHEVVATTGHQIDNLVIVGHSSEGLLTIGTDQIQFFTLKDYQPTFAAMGQTLSADAQIQFYGCSVAGNVFGQALVDRIATYTTADVFASIDTTGGTRHDFSLEYSSNAAVHMDTVLATTALSSVKSELVENQPWVEIQTGNAGGWNFYTDNPLFTNVNGNLFFRAGNNANDVELYFSNGTDTYRVMDINSTSGTASSSPMDLISFQGKLFFTADDGVNGRELWVSDGVQGGGVGHTYKFAEINPATGSTGGAFGTTGNNFTVFNGKLYFTANDGSNGLELWVTDGVDGTLAHTHMVKDLTAGGSSTLSNLTVVGDNLFFAGITSAKNLWKYDGVNDPSQVSTAASAITSMVNFNGTLFFGATGNGLGSELWKSDGTSWGTVQFADTTTGSGSTSPTNFTVVNDYLFFTDWGGLPAKASKIYGTDGVSAPTVINAPNASSFSGITTLTESGGRLFFMEASTTTTNTPQLWMYNPSSGLGGQAQNLTQTALNGVINQTYFQICDANGTPFFVYQSTPYGWEIFDYNPANTPVFTEHPVDTGNTQNTRATFPFFVNGSVFWTGATTQWGRELYKFTTSPWETAGQGPTNFLGSLGGAYTEDDPTLLTFGGASPAFQVSDGNGDNLNVKLVASAGFSGISVDGITYDKVVNLSGTAASINAQLLNLTGYLKPNFSGAAEIDITSTDPSGWTDTDRLFATVNPAADAPEITLPTGTVTKTENDNITTPLALASATSLFKMFDADPGDMLTLTAWINNPADGTPGGYSGVNLTSNTGLQTSHSIQGTWDVINAAIANKIYVTKSQDFNGAARLWFTLSDGVNETTAVYDKVTFTAINDLPVNNIVSSSWTTNEDTPVAFSTANGNRVFISDVDIAAGGTQNFTVTLTTAKPGVGNTGNILVIEDALHPLTSLTGNGTNSVTLNGSLDHINIALDGMQFIPYAENYAYTGTSNAVLNITTSDNGNIGTGGTLTDSDTINFTVSPVADAPVNTLSTFNAAAGTTLVNLANGINVHDGDVNDIMFVEVSAGTGVSGLGWGWRTKYSPEYVFVGMEGFLNLPQVLSGLKAAIQPGFAGQATVHVTTGDIGGLTDTDTLSIWVDAPPGAPVITPGATGYDVWEDHSPVNLGSCVNVTDPNNDFLTVTLTAPDTSGWSGLAATAASGATVSGLGTTADPLVITGLVAPIQNTLVTLTGTLKADFNGDAAFDVTAFDGTTHMASQVIVPIGTTNDAPVAGVVAAVGNEDSAIPVTFSMTDPVDAAFAGGANLLQSVNVVPGLGPLHGTLTATANPANWVYTPDPDWFGTDTFAYTVTDNGGTGLGGADTSAQVTGSVTVNSVADAPVATAAIVASGNEDSPITITGLGMAGDPHDAAGPGGANTLVSVGIAAAPANGTVENIGGNWVYTPNPNWFGTDTFTYTVTDNGDAANGGAIISAPETVTVNVASVNDAPVAVPLNVNVNPNSSVPITLAMTDPQDAAGPGGPNALAAVIVTPPSHGTLTPTPGDPAHWTYAPEAGYVGPDSFTYSVTDNGTPGETSLASATVNINVAFANTAPSVNPAGNPVLTAINEDPAVNPGTTVASIIASAGANISDADSNPLGLAITGADTAHGTWQYSTDNGATWNLLGTVSDTNATLLNGSALVKFVPNANWNGLAAITFHAWDQTTGTNGQQNVNIGPGGGTSAFSVAADSAPITVNSVNDAPVPSPTTLTLSEDTPTPVTVSITDPLDALGSGGPNPLATVSYTQPAHGTVTGTGANLTYTPAANYNGPDSFTYTVTDNGGTANGGVNSATQAVAVTVNAVNDAPVNTVPLIAQSGKLNTPLIFNAANGTAISVADVDAGTAAIQVDLTATHGTLTLGSVPGGLTVTGNGSAAVHLTGSQATINTALSGLKFTPTSNYSGAATVTMVSNDLGNTGGTSTPDTDVVNINIFSSNQPPVNNVPTTTLTSPVNTPLYFGSAYPNQITISDANAGSYPLQVSLTAANGSITLGSTAGLTFSYGTGTGDQYVIFTGTLSSINAALNGMRFTPTSPGLGYFSIFTDDQGSGWPNPLYAMSTVMINVV